MRTTLILQDDLFDDLLEITGAKTKTAAVTMALKDWLRKKKLEKIKNLRGKVEFTYDILESRELEIKEMEETYDTNPDR